MESKNLFRENMLRFFKMLYQQNFGIIPFDPGETEWFDIDDVPRQGNGIDCGVFLMMLAKDIVNRGKLLPKMSVSQEKIYEYRWEIFYELAVERFKIDEVQKMIQELNVPVIDLQEQMVNPSSSLAIEPYYVDHRGKKWAFHANVGKNISHKKLLTDFGFSTITKNETTLNLHCQKENPAGGSCPFAGIYLKSNGCLYTRGEHKHTMKGKTPKNVGDDYVDRQGNVWTFHKEIGKNISENILKEQFGFSTILPSKVTLSLYCRRKKANGQKCSFRGIYLKSNGCLYVRGKHEHT